jgi:hypothetical protein
MPHRIKAGRMAAPLGSEISDTPIHGVVIT